MIEIISQEPDKYVDISDEYQQERKYLKEIEKATVQAREEAENAKNTAISYKGAADAAKNEAVNAKNQAVSAKNEIEGYSIPTEATYNIESLDQKFENLSIFTASGLVEVKEKSEIFYEGDTPNTIACDLGKVNFGGDVVNVGQVNAVFSPAPFAPNTTDELLDYSQHGVTTQVNHKKGDIVVCGNGGELVQNGDFSSDDLSEWSVDSNEGAIEIENSKLKIVRNSGENNCSFYYSFTDTATNKLLKLEISGIGDDHLNILGNNTGRYLKRDLKNGTYSFIVPKICTGLEFLLAGDSASSGTCYIDNISITPIEQTYQSITTTTAGDFLTDTTKFQPIDYVTRQDVFAVTKNGSIKTYKGVHLFDETVSTDAIASAYGWVKKGKGLYNDGQDDVVILGLNSRLNAGGYHPVYNAFGCGEYVFTGQHASYWYSSDIPDFNGLFDLCTISEYPNDGYRAGNIAYNPIYARPDSKFYDKVYYEGLGGIIFLPTYAKRHALSDILESESHKIVNGDELGLSCGVESFCLDIDLYTGNGWINSLYTDHDTKCNSISFRTQSINNRDRISVWDKIFGLTVVYIDSGRIECCQGIMTDSEVKSFVESMMIPLGKIIVTKQTSYFLTQSTNTTVDVIGNPSPYTSTDATYISPTSTSITDMPTNTLVWDNATGKMYKALVATNDLDSNGAPVPAFSDTSAWQEVRRGYPTDWLDYLSKGKALPFNPLLVGENGEDCLSPTYNNPKMSKKMNSTENNSTQIILFTPISMLFTRRIDWEDVHSNRYNTEQCYGNDTKVIIFSYKSKNTSFTPYTAGKPLLKKDFYYAQNIHDITKGAMIANSLRGKISTGTDEIEELSWKKENNEIIVTPVQIPDVVYTISLEEDEETGQLKLVYEYTDINGSDTAKKQKLLGYWK